MTYPPARFHGSDGEVSATLRAATTPPDLTMATGVNVSFLLSADDTDEQFGLYRWDAGDQAVEAFPHFHRGMSETFFVLSGTFDLHDGTAHRAAGPGDSLFVPPGGIHGFRNSNGPASMLILFTPGAPREEYFRLLAERAAGRLTPSPEEWRATSLAHDQVNL